MSGDLVVMDRPNPASPRTALPVGHSNASAAPTNVASAVQGSSPPQSPDSLPHQCETDRSWRRTLNAFYDLTKPRIVLMILIVTAMACLFADATMFSLVLMFHLMLGTALVAGSASAVNQYLERDADAKMRRTRHRPLPSARITPPAALAFGLLIGAMGTIYLALLVNPLTACVGVATWVGYVAIYTPMKMRTAWNTTVGAVAGALPMLMGYTAAGGKLGDATGWLLVAVLFLWQYPHFMAIAWLYRKQYDEAGFVMTTTVEPTGRSAGWQAVAGSIALPIVMLVLLAPLAHWWIMAVLSIAASAGMIRSSLRFRNNPDDRSARRLLISSLFQLPASLAVLSIARLL